MAIIRSRAPDVLAWLFTAGCLCNNARIAPPNGTDHATWSILGDPTEASVIVAARKALIDPEALAKSWPVRANTPLNRAASA